MNGGVNMILNDILKCTTDTNYMICYYDDDNDLCYILSGLYHYLNNKVLNICCIDNKLHIEIKL